MSAEHLKEEAIIFPRKRLGLTFPPQAITPSPNGTEVVHIKFVYDPNADFSGEVENPHVIVYKNGVETPGHK